MYKPKNCASFGKLSGKFMRNYDTTKLVDEKWVLTFCNFNMNFFIAKIAHFLLQITQKIRQI